VQLTARNLLGHPDPIIQTSQIGICRSAFIVARQPYESDTTRFIRDFLEKNPEIREKQRAGRSMWWDRVQDREQREQFRKSSVPKKPYEYY